MLAPTARYCVVSVFRAVCMSPQRHRPRSGSRPGRRCHGPGWDAAGIGEAIESVKRGRTCADMACMRAARSTLGVKQEARDCMSWQTTCPRPSSGRPARVSGASWLAGRSSTSIAAQRPPKGSAAISTAADWTAITTSVRLKTSRPRSPSPARQWVERGRLVATSYSLGQPRDRVCCRASGGTCSRCFSNMIKRACNAKDHADVRPAAIVLGAVAFGISSSPTALLPASVGIAGTSWPVWRWCSRGARKDLIARRLCWWPCWARWHLPPHSPFARRG